MEIEWNELLQMRFDLVDRMSRTSDDLNLNKETWVRYILSEIGKLPDDLIDNLMRRETVEKVDQGKDRETKDALTESEEKIERALLFEEALRASVATSGGEATLMLPEKMTALVERHKEQKGKLAEAALANLEAAVKEEVWDEKILHGAPAVETFNRLKEQKVRDRVNRLRMLASSGGVRF
jgi:hypothetical protein